MPRLLLLLLLLAGSASALERIAVSSDRRSFIHAESKTPFRPWGMNYGNKGRLMEDFWDHEWETFAGDFRELKALGANVVRVHLQVGKFMSGPDQPIEPALAQLTRLLRLAEESGLYLDVTGLACYRPEDTPAWYDALDEPTRWKCQAHFWSTIAQRCASSRAVFCYDLINEPLSPGEKRQPGQWPSGSRFGGFDFLQYIALDPAGRRRDRIAAEWIRHLTTAIRRHDPATLITVGLLPWDRAWGHLSGFLPETTAPEVDFMSVHIYPDSKKPGEALEGLQKFAVGKPLVIEETFPLSCTPAELEEFLLASAKHACGWIGHYDGAPLAELDALAESKEITLPQSVYRAWQQLFTRLKPQLAPAPRE